MVIASPAVGFIAALLIFGVYCLVQAIKRSGKRAKGKHGSEGRSPEDGGRPDEHPGRLGYRVEPRPDHEESVEEQEARFRRSYRAAFDCEPCNMRPAGDLIADIEECAGVDVAKRGKHQEQFARYGKGAWMWVIVTREHIRKGRYEGWPTIEVWLDGESAGYLTPLQTSRHYFQVPEGGGVTQAHIQQDNKTGVYHMRVELPPKHDEIFLEPFIERHPVARPVPRLSAGPPPPPPSM
ncbi:hypothetical protein [Bifidobacterium xylocopae]|uniref:Uncharacterized protein n=1 Tax=Bifidobacterium xylocopae TaxID=2493119 RepID=A0A366KG15_9BIFI|nr:hypothetical protein [Bifidobacterium xylocopae]RBQ00034.1 hypothetical protein CRD59_00800 [Bifidobacterium xylocopae]